MNAHPAPEVFETYVQEVAAADIKMETKSLDFFYGKTQSLHGVSIPFADGTVMALIGPSGCGKSTLLRARVGMVFQQPTPFPMTIYEHIAFGIRLYEQLSKSGLDGSVGPALRGTAL